MNESLLSYVVTLSAFAFFVVCPRLGAMTNLLNKHAPFSIYRLVILGTFVSIPLLILMTWMICHWGLMAGLGLAVATDLAAAVILTSVSTKVAVETFIIALFVVAGNRIATWIGSTFL